MVEDFTIESVDQEEVLRYLGHHGQSIPQSLQQRLDKAFEDCKRLARPRASIRFFDIEKHDQEADGTPIVYLKDSSLELRGTSIDTHLQGACQVGVFATTIGMAVDQELRKLALTNQLGELLFDATANAMVERSADAAETRIVEYAAKKNLYTNYRFSPGYGDLPMETQPALLAALDAQRRLGITLASTMLMSPIKSVTAIIGIFDTPQPSSHASCANCFCAAFCNLRARTGRTCYE